MIKSRTKIETVKNIMEIIALFGAGCYFLFRISAGWYGVTMSIEIETLRVHDPKNIEYDILAVDVKLKNGNGQIRIYDAIAAVTSNNQTQVERLNGIIRYDFKNNVIIHGKQHPKNHRTGLGTNQQITLSTYFCVPTGSVCVVDATILARRRIHNQPSETRSTTVSLPIKIND